MTLTLKERKKLLDKLNKKAATLCWGMGCRVYPRVEFSSNVDKNSGQVYPDGRIVFNDEYIELNKRNPQVMHNLVAHECAHLADPDPSGTQHDESFMSVYKKFGRGIKNDPLYLGNEQLTTPHYALICKKCGSVWFYQGKTRKTKYCPDDNNRLSQVDLTRNKYLTSIWRKIYSRNNKTTKKELEKIF